MRQIPRVNFSNQETGQVYARMVAGKLEYWDARLCDRAFSGKRSRAAIKTIIRTQEEVVCHSGEEGGRLDPRQNMTLGEWGKPELREAGARPRSSAMRPTEAWRSRGLALTSHTGAWARPTRTRNGPCVMVVLARWSSAMSCLRSPAKTVDNRNVIRLGIAANAPTKTAGQPHHMSVVERGVRSSELPPPQPETAWVMSHPEMRVQYDAINAVIAAAREILIKSAQPVAHEGHGRYSGVLTSSCPQRGPFFAAASAKKRRPL